MRKTNNREGSGSEQGEGDFWVVSDADTGEHLVAYDQYGSEVWKDIVIEEGIDGGVADIDTSARFWSEDDARVVAQSLADQIAQEHPDDPVCLLISRLSVETVEMVIATESLGQVVPHRDAEGDSEPDDDGALARDESDDDEDEDDDADADDGAPEAEDGWFVGSRARGGSDHWSALNDEPAPKKMKGTKKQKKSTRKS